MNKFKKFIITKILREPIPPIMQKPLIVKERCDIETIGVVKVISTDIPKEYYRDDIACNIGRYLMKSGFIKIKICGYDNPREKQVTATVDVVRRSEND